jgi:hypothetical protein
MCNGAAPNSTRDRQSNGPNTKFKLGYCARKQSSTVPPVETDREMMGQSENSSARELFSALPTNSDITRHGRYFSNGPTEIVRKAGKPPEGSNATC